jgi:hypothetical protein
MDPIYGNIKRQRELAAEIIAHVEAGPNLAQSEGDHGYLLDTSASKLAELVQALEKWRLRGDLPYFPYPTVNVR